MGWLGELAKHATELQARDVAIVRCAADSVADLAELAARFPRLTMLSDLDLSVVAAWGLRIPGADTPSPGTFVVGRDGVVGWSRLGDQRGDWPTYPEVAAALTSSSAS